MSKKIVKIINYKFLQEKPIQRPDWASLGFAGLISWLSVRI